MWSYYGSKSKVVDLYPPPKFNTIIEPFAGSARYSLKYWNRDVLLVDKYSVIVDLWKFLQQCSYNDIMSLPELKKGKKFDTNGLTKNEINLLGFIAGQGVARPQMTCGTFDGMNSHRSKKNIADNLFKIKHWKIVQASYEDLPNQEATWFIDPPYQFGGQYYKHPTKNIDFTFLAKWCKTRKGQSIVCENTKADWLDFKPMKEMQGSIKKTTEAIWSNIPTNYDNEQLRMF